MANYYNEFDPKAAAWLRELIKAGEIPPGDVDERSIEDVAPADLSGYVQCHFFAGIGGWPLALRLAGWPDDREIWTGSCPCQPFSAAGEGNGFDDERHLWPAFAWLIRQCKPAVVVGEQVASKAAEPWLDVVFADMESMGYACGALASPAASVGSPHIRDRTYWTGHSDNSRLEGFGRGLEASPGHGQGTLRPAASPGESLRLAYPDGGRRSEGRQGTEPGVPDANGVAGSGRPGATNGAWRDADWLACRDGKWRPVEPGTFPLAHGIPARVGRLRGYGNAIVPQAAAQFVIAAEAARHGR